VFDTHERPIAGLKEKLCVDQSAKKCVARSRVEPPEAARLRLRKAQSRHFEELALDPPEHFVGCAHWLWRHEGPPTFCKDETEGATGVPLPLLAEPIGRAQKQA
jgi:hypothetical protein